MTILIVGTVRLPPENVEAFRPHMLAMLEASRAEPGCIEYSYGFDVADLGLVRVFEAWRDPAAIDAHFASDHLQAWRSSWIAFGVTDRRLVLYETAAERPI